MPNLKASIKSLRQTERRTEANQKMKKRLKDSVKKFSKLVEAGEKSEAMTAYSRATKMLDKAAKKNILHKSTASRKKSRLAKRLNKITATNVQTA